MQQEEAAIAWLLQTARSRVEQRRAQNACLVCGAPARVQERLAIEHVFCRSAQCHARHFALDQFFGLGMPKRLREVRNVALQSQQRFPDEILCYLLLLAFDARLRSREEYDALHELRHTSVQFRRVIDDCVVPQISDLADELTRDMETSALLEFHGLRRLTLRAELKFDGAMRLARRINSPPGNSTRLLAGLTQLQELFVVERDYNGEERPVQRVGTQELLLATQLRSLTLHNSQAPDEALRALTNLEYLEFNRLSPRMSREHCLETQSNLRTLVLRRTVSLNSRALTSLSTLVLANGAEVPSDPMPGLERLYMLDEKRDYSDAWLLAHEQLRHLALALTAQVTDVVIGRLSELRSLALEAVDESVTAESVGRLTKLEALAVRNVQMDANALCSAETFAPMVGTLRWLDLADSVWRWPAGVVRTLVNLTYLDLTDVHGGDMGDARLDDDGLARLVQLRTLILDGNGVITGLGSFDRLSALTALSIRGFSAVAASAVATLVPSLLQLDMSNRRHDSADWLSQLTRLEVLYEQNHSWAPSVLQSIDALRPLHNLTAIWFQPLHAQGPDLEYLDNLRSVLPDVQVVLSSKSGFAKGIAAMPQWDILRQVKFRL